MDQRFVAVQTGERPPDFLQSLNLTAVEQLRQLLRRGSYIVLFWSVKAQESRHVSAELDMGLKEFPHQIIVATTDETPFPSFLLSHLKPENIVSLKKDGDLSQFNRIDDLIVRLYWLVAARPLCGP
jgi:hypothetical protein